MPKKMLLIMNAKAGKGAIKTKIADIVDLFTAGGYDVLVHPTQKRGDSYNTAMRLGKDADIIVCSGGDGTMGQVVSAVMDLDPKKTVGYIPAGSTNDFANSLGLHKNPIKAAECILDGHVYDCDIGSFNEKNFVYVAAFGAFTSIAYDTNQDLKNMLGHFAYLTQAGQQVFNLPNYHIRAKTDDEIIEGNYTYGMITNSHFVGGMRYLTGPAVDMNDGVFEVTLVHTPTNPLEVTGIITSLLSGGTVQSKYVERYKASRITIYADEPLDWTLDGDFGGTFAEADIRNLHKMLHICTV